MDLTRRDFRVTIFYDFLSGETQQTCFVRLQKAFRYKLSYQATIYSLQNSNADYEHREGYLITQKTAKNIGACVTHDEIHSALGLSVKTKTNLFLSSIRKYMCKKNGPLYTTIFLFHLLLTLQSDISFFRACTVHTRAHNGTFFRVRRINWTKISGYALQRIFLSLNTQDAAER